MMEVDKPEQPPSPDPPNIMDVDMDEPEQPISADCLTDWDLCVLCQHKTKEKLQCPAGAKQKGGASTYMTLACNL